MLDAEVSPDGKRLALISNQGSNAYQLWLADDPRGLRAVERQADAGAGLQGDVARRQQGAVDRPGRCATARRTSPSCSELPVNDLRNPKELNVAGDDPSFQPLTDRGLTGVLCPSCRRQLERGASYCGSCGTPLNGSAAPLELVLADATRVPVVGELTIGRAPGVSLLLSDPSVSRVHARITADAVLEDAGSSHGTFLDGVRLTEPSPLRDGAKIRLGDAELRVERRRESTEAGRTIVVQQGAVLAPIAAGHRARTSG